MSVGTGPTKRGETLFEVPIEGTGNPTVGGKVVVSKPASQVYLVTFKAGPDNRLSTPFCQAVILALDIIEHKYEPGVVITTSGIGKFYSNGLDLDHANTTPGFFKNSLYALWHRLMTYSMPTIALINGHAFAGGFMLAMMHDYRVQNPHKGYLCLNEVELGVPLRPPMTSVFRQKVSASTYRKMVLEAHRFKALEALKEGIVDWLGGLPEALAHIEEFKLVQKAKPGVTGLAAYPQLKQEMYRETIQYLEETSEESIRQHAKELQWRKEKQGREEKVRAWDRTKAKL